MWRSLSGARVPLLGRPGSRAPERQSGIFRRAQRRRFRFTYFCFAVTLLAMTGLTLGPGLYATWRLSKQDELEEMQRKITGHESTSDEDQPIVNEDVCRKLQTSPWVCAHGGDTTRAPPNTIAAYDLALREGVDCIEVDASRTADGVLVALHDRDLQAFATTPGVRVGHLTLQQIQEYDAGLGFHQDFSGQKVPTLENALRMLTGRVKQVTVDVKLGPPLYEHNLAADIIQVIGRAGCKDCLAWAKQDSIVADLKALSPSLRAGYIVMRDSASGEVGQLLRMEAPEVVAVYHGLATRHLVGQAHRGGKEVHVWTVDEESAMRRMVQAGVDSIVTNRPREVQQIIQQHRNVCREHGFKVF